MSIPFSLSMNGSSHPLQNEAALRYCILQMPSRARGLNPELGVFLGKLHQSYHRRELLSSDPLEFVHQYEDPHDQEAVALLSALLAYGNVKQIRRSLENAFTRIRKLSPSPSEFVRALRLPDFRKRASTGFQDFVHRFNRGDDVLILLELLAESWQRYGSLGAHFLSYLEPDAQDVGGALNALIGDWRQWAMAKGAPPIDGDFGYLLTAPQDGSCCKRWCMFLRWMGRKDELDPGLWTRSSSLWASFPSGRALEAKQLVIPLDTHTGRISQYLQLTRRKSLNWKAALEVTRNLALYDPADPTRYDFAISRLGILDLCQRRYRQEICERCQLVAACKFAKLRSRSRGRVSP